VSLSFILLLVGLVLLIGGAELLVRGASNLAAALGISRLVIGLTVVAFGTSSPEIAVSVQSAMAGQANLAIGNLVGSNIFNILFILGISAAITPLIVSQQLIRFDVPVMIAATFVVLILGLDSHYGRFDAAVLLLLLLGYLVLLLVFGRKEAEPAADEIAPPRAATGWLLNVVLVVVGLALLVWGSRWLVAGALDIAKALGVSELIIGLTIVAAGTSLPEVATSVIAALRQQRDIAVGNVIGSCTFNLLAVLGVASFVAPGGIPLHQAALAFDIPIMVAVSVAAWPILWSSSVISRGEGVLFFFYYIAYTLYLILQAAEHDALPLFNTVLLFFVIPVTVMIACMVALRTRRDRELRQMQRAPAPR
jgi:cation:H+ antiporter